MRIYDGWRYPGDWVVESFSQEGPKIVKRGDYYYMVLAEGGTAGPPTGHMIVSARSKSIDGPWENSPYNPIVRTMSVAERWWSKGHGTLVEGRDSKWFIVYHAYENGFYTLGRQTLLQPIEWTADGAASRSWRGPIRRWRYRATITMWRTTFSVFALRCTLQVSARSDSETSGTARCTDPGVSGEPLFRTRIVLHRSEHVAFRVLKKHQRADSNDD